VSLVLRTAQPSDLAAVQRITEAAFAPYNPRIGMRPVPMDADHAALIDQGSTWVAVVDDEVAGFCVVLTGPGHLLLDIVAVDPAWRGRGAGGELIAHAERLAAGGPGELRLYTHRLMTENIELYRHLGYREVPPPPDDQVPRVHFVKRLTPGR